MSNFTIRPALRRTPEEALAVPERERDRPRRMASERVDFDFARICEQASQRTALYEVQIKELESKLAEDLGNFRTLDRLLQDAKGTLERTSSRTARALDVHAPYVSATLADALSALHELAARLPLIRAQVRQIRRVYARGRATAQQLVADLAFLSTPLPARCAQIIFTASAPVSWKKKALARAVAACFFVLSAWFTWIVLAGAVRAHRHRLVWGERLMS